VVYINVKVRRVTSKWVGINGRLEEGHTIFASGWLISMLYKYFLSLSPSGHQQSPLQSVVPQYWSCYSHLTYDKCLQSETCFIVIVS